MTNIKSISAVFLAGLMLSSNASALSPNLLNTIIVNTGLLSTETAIKTNNTYDDKNIKVYFASIDRLIRTNNKTVQSFKETLASVGSTDTSSQFEGQIESYELQNISLSQQAAGYIKSAEELSQAAQTAQDEATKAALEAQANAMQLLAQQAQANISMNNGIISGLEELQEDAQHQLDDTYAATEKQLENAADQIVIGAETQYITLLTIENSINSLERTIASLDRNIEVMETQLEIGMASELDLKTLENQRDSAKSSLDSLISQKKTVENSLSVLLGNDTDTYAKAQSLPLVYPIESYEEDLEQAMKNSYAIWQKADTARKASNDYENYITSTVDAYEAAKLDLEATKKQTEASFKSLYESVLEKERLLEKAEDDLEFAEQNFEVSEVKYNIGNISKLEYENAKDTLANANDAVETAKIELFTAYNKYQWGIKGVI